MLIIEGGMLKAFETTDVELTTWLLAERGDLFCFMGKPGSGKSVLIYAYMHLPVSMNFCRLGPKDKCSYAPSTSSGSRVLEYRKAATVFRDTFSTLRYSPYLPNQKEPSIWRNECVHRDGSQTMFIGHGHVRSYMTCYPALLYAQTLNSYSWSMPLTSANHKIASQSLRTKSSGYRGWLVSKFANRGHARAPVTVLTDVTGGG